MSALKGAVSLIKGSKYRSAAVGGTAALGLAVGLDLKFNRFAQDTSQTTPGGTISKQTGAPKVFKFPLEEISAGDFWTKMTVLSWVPIKKSDDSFDGQTHHLNKYLISNIWLPMPLTLGTAYNQRFSEVEDMMVNRGVNEEGEGGWNSFIQGLQNVRTGAGNTAMGLANETNKLLSAVTALNVSAKMGMGSVVNQHMGLLYDGASLRSHSFSWRMTPKNRNEQKHIQQIITALKGYASPAVKGIAGGAQDVNHSTSAPVAEQVTAEAQMDPAITGTNAGINGDTLKNIGRLGIPPTISVEFWYKVQRNPHLFQVKDSFIQSLEVNYTPTGTWNAYEDGAPIETQLTLNLKENSVVTQNEVTHGGL